MLQWYDSVIRSQLQQGIIEIMSEPDKPFGPVHFLPHHPVIRGDKTTTKLRIVYDASAKQDGPLKGVHAYEFLSENPHFRYGSHSTSYPVSEITQVVPEEV